MTRPFATRCLLGLIAGLGLAAGAAHAQTGPALEIPEVVVEGSEPNDTVEVPIVKPTDPTLEAEFTLPPLGASESELDLRHLRFRTDADLFPQAALPKRDGMTHLRAGLGGLDLYSGGFWDSRQYGGFSSFWQGEATAGNGFGGLAPWQRQRLAGGFGWDLGAWRLSLGGEGDRLSRQDGGSASQTWGTARLSAVQAIGEGSLTYRLGWESGRLTAPEQDAQAHGGEGALRFEPRWGDHQPVFEGGGGYHMALNQAWPTANVLVGDRFQLGDSHWEAGLRYQMIGNDHSVAPALRIGWRGWPETVLSFGLDGGQQGPYAGSLWRARPFARIGSDLRSEHTLAKASLGLERRLVPGLVLGLGAEAAGVDRLLYWTQVDQGPYWELRNAPGPMLVWGGKAELSYDLGVVTPFARYHFRQATATDPSYPTDGAHDLRAGMRLQVGPVHAEASAHLLAWALSAASTGQNTVAAPNMLLLDGSLAYDITDTVQLRLTLTDWLLRSNDVLSGYWEPAFTALGGIGVQF